MLRKEGGVPAVGLEVCGSSSQAFGIVSEQAQAAVAVPAQHAAQKVGGVVVIDVQSALTLAGGVAADGALVGLGVQPRR